MARNYDDLYGGAGEDEAFELLASLTHGQLSHWNRGQGRPEMAFMHYAVSSDPRQILGHLSNNNPMLELLDADPRATFWVEGGSAYVPSHWYTTNQEKAVPTSYYSWAQFEVEVELVRNSEGMLEILKHMLAVLQSEGSHPPMDPTQKFWQGMLGAITGLKMNIVSSRSRHKLGQNRPVETRREIAAKMDARGLGQDAEMAEQVLARL